MPVDDFLFYDVERLPKYRIGLNMKAIFIGNKKFREIDLIDLKRDEDFIRLIDEYSLMESPIIYFSAGDAKIKEILIKKDPTFSA
jgi:hypothetical protein